MAEKRPHEDDIADAVAVTEGLKRVKQDDSSGEDAAVVVIEQDASLLMPSRRSRRSAAPRENSDEPTGLPADSILGSSNAATTEPPTVQSLQAECDRLRGELRSAQAATKSAKEQAALVKELYDDASRSTLEAQRELDELKADNVLLRRQLTEGLTTVRLLAKGQTDDLQDALETAEAQVQFLTAQNRLTNDTIRAKAAKWDAMEAKEEERRQEIARRQAKREAERRALQESLLGGSNINGGEGLLETSSRRRQLPHEMFAAVDLAEQKTDVDALEEAEQEKRSQVPTMVEDLPPYTDDIDDDDEDEVAALQREAAQFSAGQRPT